MSQPPKIVPRSRCRCTANRWIEDPPESGDWRCASCGYWDFKSAREWKPEARRQPYYRNPKMRKV